MSELNTDLPFVSVNKVDDSFESCDLRVLPDTLSIRARH